MDKYDLSQEGVDAEHRDKLKDAKLDVLEYHANQKK